MKKFTSTFFAVLLVVMFATVTFAGPVDWVMDKLGYTPTAVYETQVQQTQKALAAAKLSQEAAKQLAATAELQSNVINYGGIALIVLGGFGYIRRKKIAHTIIMSDVKKPAPVQRELAFGEKPTIAL